MMPIMTTFRTLVITITVALWSMAQFTVSRAAPGPDSAPSAPQTTQTEFPERVRQLLESGIPLAKPTGHNDRPQVTSSIAPAPAPTAMKQGDWLQREDPDDEQQALNDIGTDMWLIGSIDVSKPLETAGTTAPLTHDFDDDDEEENDACPKPASTGRKMKRSRRKYAKKRHY